MFDFFKGIVVFFTAITLPISGLLIHQKPVIKPIAKNTISPTPTKNASLTVTIPQTVMPHKSMQADAQTTEQIPTVILPTNIPIPTTTQTYSILSLAQLVNMNGASALSIAAAQSAYNLFLQTPKLQFMSPTQQQQIFAPLLNTAIQSSIKAQLQNTLQQKQAELDTLNQQAQPTQASQNNSQSSQALQVCINNRIATINSNPFLSESSRQAQVANASQYCINQTQQ